MANDLSLLESLHPEVQEMIRTRWAGGGFRPVQRAAIPPVLAGSSVLVLSPTAGGKTEAGFLPVLSMVFDTALQSNRICAIYIAPLKALLNDLEERLNEWLEDIPGISLFKWHGDVSVTYKKKQMEKPAAFLLTTPESLDVMLSSPRPNFDRVSYFSEVRTIIIDEAHYFAADSRGAQLSSQLERLQEFSQHKLQRVGLSATVGDPEAVADWLAGSGPDIQIVRAEGAAAQRNIQHAFIDEDDSDAVNLKGAALRRMVGNSKSIVFGNSRRSVEATARMLEQRGVRALVHHGSVSRLLREDNEEIMRTDEDNCAISATSTLELGIDIGNLNSVVQMGRLPSVNSYLQRRGRAGREGQIARIGLIADNFEEFVLNLAIVSLGAENYCEPLRPSTRRYDVLFQQLLLDILGNYGMTADRFWNKVRTAFCFRDVTFTDLEQLIEYWISQDWLLREAGGTLLLGSEVQRIYGSRNYMELFSVFEVNEYFEVLHGRDEIGLLESWFAASLLPEISAFQLAGRRWLVLEVDAELKRVFVHPSKEALPPNWSGGGIFVIEYAVARRYQDILAGTYDLQRTIEDEGALKTLSDCRASLGHFEVPDGRIGVRSNKRHIWLHTYAGTAINHIIRFAMERAFPDAATRADFDIVEIESRNIQIDPILGALHDFFAAALTWSMPEWEDFLKQHIVDFKYSRFSPYLPPEISVRHAASAHFILTDLQSYVSNLESEVLRIPDA
jgi:ATP-dependent Lhr-like helicase